MKVNTEDLLSIACKCLALCFLALSFTIKEEKEIEVSSFNVNDLLKDEKDSCNLSSNIRDTIV